MDSQELADRLKSGISHLTAHRPQEAILALLPAANDAGLEQLEELQDIRARVLSLLAQAHLECGEIELANARVRAASRILRALDDKDGLAEVRELSTRVFQAGLQRRNQRDREQELLDLARLPLAEALGSREGVARAERLIERADGELLLGETASAIAHAEEALRIGQDEDSVREVVLALLALARCSPDHAQLHLGKAWHRAEQADEFNLVGLVVNAAAALGVALPSLHGPSGEVR